MKVIKVLGVVLVTLLFLGGSTSVFAQDYDHNTKVDKMDLSWKVDGEDLKVKISAKTTGWVGIGFNPSAEMKDANYVLGYVKDGKAKLTDDFGNGARTHKSDKKLGGTSNVTLIGGSEKDGITTLEFSLPLNSGDKMDSVIEPAGETVVLLAYGGKRDSFKSKHKFRTSLKINLASGKIN